MATSSQSFVEIYKFLTGKKPTTSEIVREKGAITIAGRAVLFPHNRGILGATVELWEIDGATGQRTGPTPVARFVIGESGAWGPVAIQSGRHYEFALLRPGASPNHYYYEPFVRSDHLVRLLDSDALEAAGDKSPNHTALAIIRYKELWGDQGAESDILALNGTNVCNPATCPIEHQVNAVFAGDRFSDGRTDLSEPHPVYFALPFVTGVDVFLPAATPPTGKVSLALTSRGAGPKRTLNFPNFASTSDAIVVQLNDFELTRP